VSEEPGAVVPHAGICAGGVRVTGVPTATKLFKNSCFLGYQSIYKVKNKQKPAVLSIFFLSF